MGKGTKASLNALGRQHVQCGREKFVHTACGDTPTKFIKPPTARGDCHGCAESSSPCSPLWSAESRLETPRFQLLQKLSWQMHQSSVMAARNTRRNPLGSFCRGLFCPTGCWLGQGAGGSPFCACKQGFPYGPHVCASLGGDSSRLQCRPFLQQSSSECFIYTVVSLLSQLPPPSLIT